MKEYFVYVVSASNEKLDYDVSGYEIQNWAISAKDGRLLEGAKHFMSIAEEEGTVYSIEGFQKAFNLEEEEVGMNDYIFITNLNHD